MRGYNRDPMDDVNTLLASYILPIGLLLGSATLVAYARCDSKPTTHYIQKKSSPLESTIKTHYNR